MSGQFVVTRGGRDTFCSEDELKSMAKRGLLGAGDLVYHPTLGRWMYAREVEEVKSLVTAALELGKPTQPATVPASNAEAIAGFVLGVMGHVPLLGFLCCLLGIYFSSRALRRAREAGSGGHGLAVAGMVLSIVFLIPSTACVLLVGGVLAH